MRAGVIVAGGRSTRFEGGDKCLAPVAGRAMVRHVAERLRPTVEVLVVNGRVDQRAAVEAAMAGYPRPVAYAVDEREDEGPVAGIERGLSALEAAVSSAFVVACDMPLVEPDFVRYLFEVAEATGAEAVVPRDADGWYQALHAVYDPTAMIVACRRALDAGDRKLIAPLEHLDVVVVDPADVGDRGTPASFENVNTRADLERLEVHLEGAQ
ncbi:MAG: molybdenum cofactor guanylyltransferase [Halobacteriales archaeon]